MRQDCGATVSQDRSRTRSEKLYQAEPPWVWIDALSPEDSAILDSCLYGKEGASPVIRVLRGKKMKGFQGLMDEIGAALQFFEGFGENSNALRELLMDLNEWLPGDAYILVVSNPQLLFSERPEERAWLMSLFDGVGLWWSKPIVDNGPYNRPAAPFHVVLQCSREKLSEVQAAFPGVPLLPVDNPLAPT